MIIFKGRAGFFWLLPLFVIVGIEFNGFILYNEKALEKKMAGIVRRYALIKVIIADDEEKICQLIDKLIDWEEMRMQVSAVVHNGIDALKAIEKLHPQIVITDIRMPGYDGLEMIKRAKAVSEQSEFIIISGYTHFEYAKTAIKYGVKDYILKPVKKNELTDALNRIKNEYMEKTDRLSTEEQNRIFIKNSLDKLRAAFFSEVLFKKRVVGEELTLEKINKEYHYHFAEGKFQIVLIKVDGLEDWMQDNNSYMQDKLFKVKKKYLQTKCFDYESAFMENCCYVILNYRPEEIKEIRRALKSLLDELLLQKDILENLNITLGVGLVKESIGDINNSLKTALWAIEQRLVLGVNRIIDGEDISLNEIADSTFFDEFNKKITYGLDRMDEGLISDALDYLKEYQEQRKNLTGHEIIQMSKEAINLYLFVMRKNKFTVKDADNFFERCSTAIENIGDAQGIYKYLNHTIKESYKEALTHKKQEDHKPIREAKRYIEKHYKEAVSLEIVSDYVGFNAAYFSSLFKKETGITFLEYLTDTRMKKAKELLKETNLKVAVICEEVGYSDVKYFTKSFTKYTSLKPNEYRKIYS